MEEKKVQEKFYIHVKKSFSAVSITFKLITVNMCVCVHVCMSICTLCLFECKNYYWTKIKY